MTLKSELMARGMPAGQAALLGQDPASAPLTATGTTQVTALPLVSDFSIFGTVPNNSGTILPARGMAIVVNRDASFALNLYPPVGGNINGGATNVPISVTLGKAAVCFSNGLTWAVVMSA